MKANIINIGNSQGIILPAMLLRKLNLSFRSPVRVEINDGAIVIKPEPRQGWATAAQQMHVAEEDKLFLDDFTNEFDKEEWAW